MPFQVGSVAVHDDGQHTGSAKRNSVSGVAGLNAAGEALVSTSAPTTIAAMINVANGIAGLDAGVRVALAQMPAAMHQRRYFPTPSVNVWADEPNIDDDSNTTHASHSQGGAGAGNYITYDLGALRNIMIGGICELYNTNAVLTVGIRVEVSDDNTTWTTVIDFSSSAVATVFRALSYIGLTRYIRFEAYYVASAGARSVSIRDIFLLY